MPSWYTLDVHHSTQKFWMNSLCSHIWGWLLSNIKGWKCYSPVTMKVVTLNVTFSKQQPFHTKNLIQISICFEELLDSTRQASSKSSQLWIPLCMLMLRHPLYHYPPISWNIKFYLLFMWLEDHSYYVYDSIFNKN